MSGFVEGDSASSVDVESVCWVVEFCFVVEVGIEDVDDFVVDSGEEQLGLVGFCGVVDGGVGVG